jgi:DNA polymerase III alpha subunit (gram-positive type)
MSILNSNANRQTADVVRSVSAMITKNIGAIYRWLMVDSTDITIKGDYEAISTGYEQYVAKEVHNTQLINFLQVIGQFPEIKQYLKNENFTRPLLRAFNMEPDKVVKTEEEVTKEMQQQTQSQQQQMQQQSEAAQQAAMQQLQAQAQLQSQKIQEQTQAEITTTQQKSLIEEKSKVSEDQRKLEMQERLELIKQGNILHPANLENDSILLREVMGEQVDAEQEQLEIEQQQMMEQQMAEQQAMEQEAQMDYEAAEGGMPPPPQEGMPPEGQMPEDPTMAGPAQERLQGGPDAQQIQQREFAENAPE